MTLGEYPDAFIELMRVVLTGQLVVGFLNTLVVKRNALAGQPPDAMKVTGLKAGLATLGVIAKQAVVALDARQNGLGNIMGQAGPALGRIVR